jgi:plasmid maintenance system antidote protein VapI
MACELDKIITANVKHGMSAKNLTVEEIAHVVERPLATVKRFLDGRKSWYLEDIVRISTRLECSPLEMLEGVAN